MLRAVADYYARTRLRVTYELIFFDGVNDSETEVRRLIAFARKVPSKINVIPFHPIAFSGPRPAGAGLAASPRQAEIVEKLRQAHLPVMVRSSAGEDITAACGQLVGRDNALTSAYQGKGPIVNGIPLRMIIFGPPGVGRDHSPSFCRRNWGSPISQYGNSFDNAVSFL